MKTKLLFIFLVYTFSTLVFADQNFVNVSLNHLNWSKETEKKSTKEDFIFAELEGGLQAPWGELYGFYDLERPAQSGDRVRTAAKGLIRYRINQAPIAIYTQVYQFNELGFSEQNQVLGLGYEWDGDGWWFKPFLGFHHVSQTYYSGSNGGMLGWVLGKSFSFLKFNFLFINWHETEFSRSEQYQKANGDQSIGQNGAASLWWLANSSWTFGLQWRYAVDKLGTSQNTDAVISTLKYNL